MNLAYFRFYEELNDFLPSEKRKTTFAYSFNGSPSVKDAIEAIGIPHTEVDLILANSLSVDFSYNLKNEDRVSVYPVFESIDIRSVAHLREKPLRDLRFVNDVHLGKLSRYMRLCGFDTVYNKEFNDQDIINQALTGNRVILTRDQGLLRNKKVTHGYCIRSQHTEEQLKEVISRFDLKKRITPFTRCMICNELLIDTTKQEILCRIQPLTRRYYRKFKICPSCDRIYWNGSHYNRMRSYLKSLNCKL